jgi:hypothetical protein
MRGVPARTTNWPAAGSYKTGAGISDGGGGGVAGFVWQPQVANTNATITKFRARVVHMCNCLVKKKRAKIALRPARLERLESHVLMPQGVQPPILQKWK